MPLGTAAGIAGGIGQLVVGIGSLFGNKKNKNPADTSNNYLNQIPGAVQPYLHNQAICCIFLVAAQVGGETVRDIIRYVICVGLIIAGIYAIWILFLEFKKQ